MKFDPKVPAHNHSLLKFHRPSRQPVQTAWSHLKKGVLATACITCGQRVRPDENCRFVERTRFGLNMAQGTLAPKQVLAGGTSAQNSTFQMWFLTSGAEDDLLERCEHDAATGNSCQ